MFSRCRATRRTPGTPRGLLRRLCDVRRSCGPCGEDIAGGQTPCRRAGEAAAFEQTELRVERPNALFRARGGRVAARKWCTRRSRPWRWAMGAVPSDDVVPFRDAGGLLRDVILLAVIEPARPAGSADDDGVPGGDRRGKACLVHDAAEFAAPARTESAALSATRRR